MQCSFYRSARLRRSSGTAILNGLASSRCTDAGVLAASKGAVVSVAASQFTENYAASFGGAISLDSASLAVKGSDLPQQHRGPVRRSRLADGKRDGRGRNRGVDVQRQRGGVPGRQPFLLWPRLACGDRQRLRRQLYRAGPHHDHRWAVTRGPRSLSAARHGRSPMRARMRSPRCSECCTRSRFSCRSCSSAPAAAFGTYLWTLDKRPCSGVRPRP